MAQPNYQYEKRQKELAKKKKKEEKLQRKSVGKEDAPEGDGTQEEAVTQVTSVENNPEAAGNNPSDHS
ncbi:MAG: hypothetical protein WCI11_06030 [Candidatus Methylumidiphilus sp.]|nr:hypothetical protein [Pseudomonadota bacterium]